MYVVMVAPECAPAAKAGGLGDAVSGLSHELELRGHAVEIILPKYASLQYSDIWGLQPSYHDLWVPWYGGAVRCTVWFGFATGRKCFFIEPHSAANFFGRDRLYGYWDDPERFAFFSKAAIEFMLRANKRPDIIHCHDWQTGLVPVLLYEQYREVMPDQRVCYTIHNFRHQGTSGEQVLWATQLGRLDHFLGADRLGDDFHYRGLNPMKGGIVYSNFVTTVSPSHANEALYGDGGSGLGGTLKEHQDKFRGVLNGVDYFVWNPETDPFILASYSAESIARKYEDRGALRDRFWIRRAHRPVVAYIGRLDEQKGTNLVTMPSSYTLALGVQSCSWVTPTTTTACDHFRDRKGYLNDIRIAISKSGTARNWLISSMRARTSDRAEYVRAVRAGAAHRDALRNGACGAGDRRHDRHRVRPRPLGASPGIAQRLRLSPRRQPGRRVRVNLRLRLWSERPREFRKLIMHTGRLLVGRAGEAGTVYHQVHPAQVSETLPGYVDGLPNPMQAGTS